jgi:hypothetical protein
MQSDSRTTSQDPLLPIIPPQGFALPSVPPPGGDAMMLRDDHLPVVISASEASGGKKLGSVRYVLSISLAMAFVAGVIIWNVFAK